MTDEPRPGTTAALDARIGRLEVEQGKLSSDMALIKLEQQHQREIMTGRFGAIDANLNALTTKIDLFLDRMAASAGDVSATAAGRQIATDLAQLNVKVEGLKTISDETRGAVSVVRFIAGSGLVSGAAALITVLLKITAVIK